MNYFYLDGERTTRGPLALEDLRALSLAGRLSPDTQVCQENTETWKALHEVIPDSSLTPQQQSQEYIVHYEDNQKSWEKVRAANPVEAAKAYVARCPHARGCAVVVRGSSEPASSAALFHRVNGVILQKNPDQPTVGQKTQSPHLNYGKMTKRLRYIGLLSAGYFGSIYFGFGNFIGGLVYGAFILVLGGGDVVTSEQALRFAAMWFLATFILGWLVGFATALCYNIVAAFTGGVKIVLAD